MLRGEERQGTRDSLHGIHLFSQVSSVVYLDPRSHNSLGMSFEVAKPQAIPSGLLAV